MKLSVYSLTLKDKTPEEVSELAIDCGCEGIEWWCREGGHVDPENLIKSSKRISSVMKASGLETAGLAPYFTRYEDNSELSKICEAAAIIGAPIIRCHGIRYPAEEEPAALAAKQRKWLEEKVLPAMEEYGRKMALEQHHNTIIPTPDACRSLVDGLPAEHFGVIYDPGNSLMEGYTSPRYAAGVLGKYLAHVHVKSAMPVNDGGAMPPGRNYPMRWGRLSEGDLDWQAILNELSNKHYVGFISIEALDERESAVKMMDDAPYMRLLIDKIASKNRGES